MSYIKVKHMMAQPGECEYFNYEESGKMAVVSFGLGYGEVSSIHGKPDTSNITQRVVHFPPRAQQLLRWPTVTIHLTSGGGLPFRGRIVTPSNVKYSFPLW